MRLGRLYGQEDMSQPGRHVTPRRHVIPDCLGQLQVWEDVHKEHMEELATLCYVGL